MSPTARLRLPAPPLPAGARGRLPLRGPATARTDSSAPPHRPLTGPAAVLALQRAAGNAAVTALLKSDADHGQPQVQRQVLPGGLFGGGCSTRCGGVPAACPPSFCCPLPPGTATAVRNQLAAPLLAGIASKVTASVVPVWATWFAGGSGVQNFTGRFGSDFATDPTTQHVSIQLGTDLPAQLDPARLHALAAGTPAGATVSLRSALPPAYFTGRTARLENPSDPMQMDFNTIGTAPGNLAGGIGKTQTSCAVGATPSPQDDARILTDVRATLTRNPNGSVTVTPTFTFLVRDTVDLCPGNCGASLEQVATLPMSMMEASGVTGDVPFFVDFSGPLDAPFDVPPAAPPVPQNIVLSASTLFDFGSDQLRPGAEAALLAQLGDRPAHADLSQPFTVEGHTDSSGTLEFNQGLSERRAAAVAAVLERRFPNLAGTLSPVGFGETRPIAPNQHPDGSDDPAGRASNRRVELSFSAPPP